MKNKKFNEMVQYIHYDNANEGRLLFDTCDTLIEEANIINYLQNSSKIKYDAGKNLEENMFELANDIITDIKLDVDTSTAVLTFFDKSEQTVRVDLGDLSLETLELYA